jgi:hypothetical protein
MLSHCANSHCSKPFLRLREGRLFLVETSRTELPGRVEPSQRKRPKRVEHFWLCDQCTLFWTLALDGNQRITLVPLSQPIGRKEEVHQGLAEAG